LDDEVLSDWTIIPLEFKNDWVQSLTGWQPYDEATANANPGPRVVRGLFSVNQARDTYFDYSAGDWSHGAVFINGFNIGRYQCRKMETD